MSRSRKSIWDSLYDGPAKIASCKLKSKLMDEIVKFIKDKKFTQTDAAKKMGISQPRVSDLYRGKISKFTIDSMVEILARVGVEVDVKIESEADSNDFIFIVAASQRPDSGWDVMAHAVPAEIYNSNTETRCIHG